MAYPSALPWLSRTACRWLNLVAYGHFLNSCFLHLTSDPHICVPALINFASNDVTYRLTPEWRRVDRIAKGSNSPSANSEKEFHSRHESVGVLAPYQLNQLVFYFWYQSHPTADSRLEVEDRSSNIAINPTYCRSGTGLNLSSVSTTLEIQCSDALPLAF